MNFMTLNKQLPVKLGQNGQSCPSNNEVDPLGILVIEI